MIIHMDTNINKNIVFCQDCQINSLGYHILSLICTHKIFNYPNKDYECAEFLKWLKSTTV